MMLSKQLRILLVLLVVVHSNGESKITTPQPDTSQATTSMDQGLRSLRVLFFKFLTGEFDLKINKTFKVPHGTCNNLHITKIETPDITFHSTQEGKGKNLNTTFTDVSMEGKLDCKMCVTVIWQSCAHLRPDIFLNHLDFNMDVQADILKNKTDNTEALKSKLSGCHTEMDFSMNLHGEGFLGKMVAGMGNMFKGALSKVVRKKIAETTCSLFEEVIGSVSREINGVQITNEEAAKAKKYIFIRDQKDSGSGAPSHHIWIVWTLAFVVVFGVVLV